MNQFIKNIAKNYFFVLAATEAEALGEKVASKERCNNEIITDLLIFGIDIYQCTESNFHQKKPTRLENIFKQTNSDEGRFFPMLSISNWTYKFTENLSQQSESVGAEVVCVRSSGDAPQRAMARSRNAGPRAKRPAATMWTAEIGS